jgi:hypothetical protein
MSAQSMPAPRTAMLTIVRTSSACLSFHLVAVGRIVYRTRAFDFGPARDEARRRVQVWATAHGYRIAEARQQQRA